MYKITRVLFKHFTLGTNEEEERILDQWRKESDRNETLFHKIESREFLEQTMDPAHKKILAQDWLAIEKRTLRIERQRRLFRVCRWAAVIMIPFAFILVYLSIDRTDKDIKENLTCDLPRDLKAVIDLAGGKKIVIQRDTVFQLKVDGTSMENRLDTITFLPESVQQALSGKSHKISVSNGGEYVARLEDGTIVHIDAASTLTIPPSFQGETREVELVGHAYFKVAKDSLRPFIVKSGDINIRVLGTEFDVNAYQGEEMATTLVRGLVEVYNSHSAFKLKPNQQAKVSADGEIAVSDVNVYPFVAWKEERIVFINASLGSIMKVLERWYDIESVFLSDQMKKECFTIDIEKYEKIDRVLVAIEKTDKVFFEVKDKQIYIHKK